MAPKLNLPIGYALVSLHFSGASVPNGATTTFGVQVDPVSFNASNVGTAVKNALRASGGPYDTATTPHGIGISLLDVHVKFGPLATGQEATVSDGAAIGGAPNECVPPNTSYLITKATQGGGRRGRGRMFHPGLQETLVTGGGVVSGSALTSLQSKWSQFLTALTTAQMPMVLLHNFDAAKGQTPENPSPVNALNVSSLMATQRNRMRR